MWMVRSTCHVTYHVMSCDMAGVIKCVSVMKDTGLRLTRMAFQYLLRAARQESSEEVGVVNSEEVGVVSSEGESHEEGVASSDDIGRLLDHIKVLDAMVAVFLTQLHTYVS